MIRRLSTLLLLVGLCALAQGAQQQQNIPNDFSRFPDTGTCSTFQFRCRNSQCIQMDQLCDGHADCRDGSDETREECLRPGSQGCTSLSYQCAYGACVDGDSRCNGRKDCADGSDETGCSNYGNTGNNGNTGVRPSGCMSNQFRCDNGQCIPKTNLCDGAVDCRDRSDETATNCGSFGCPQYVFRCVYGACIDRDLQCNGEPNCADGSDEDPNLCGFPQQRPTTKPPARPTPDPNPPYEDPYNTNKPRPTSRPPYEDPYNTNNPRPTNRPPTQYPTPAPRPTPRPTRPPPYDPAPPVTGEVCEVPPQPRNGEWKLEKSQCADGRQDCYIQPDIRSLPPGAQLVYKCHSGYTLNGTSAVFCGLTGSWSKIPKCIEIRCPSLSTAAREARCSYNDNWVSCDSPVLPKTTAQLSCRNSYSQDTSDLTTRDNIRCNSKGEWEPKPIKCVSVCGVASTGIGQPLIVNGSRASISDFPWHATLYRTKGQEKQFICGATIIKDDLLVTAAHCVYDAVNKRPDRASHYYVAAGNIFRDYEYEGHDMSIVKRSRVKNIYIDCKYLGLEGNYASDIAILQIETTFTFSAVLMPVCLDLTSNGDLTVLEPGNYGKVAGFGRTSKGESSFILQTLTVPYVSLTECKTSSVASDSERFITIDKFCAGYSNGSSVCDGDSGGGLVFKTDNKWYLRGIVSVGIGIKKEGAVKMCDSHAYSLYTRVSSHMEWIQDIILRVETNKPLIDCS